MSIESTFVYRENPGLIGTLEVHIDPTKVSLNYMVLYVSRQIQNTTPVNTVVDLVNEYVNNVLQGVEVDVRTYTVNQFSSAFSDGQGNIGDTSIDRLIIPKSEDVRKVVKLLWRRNELTADNRADIEIPLKKLKKSVEYAEKIRDDVEPTVAQKEIIEELVSPYIEGIQEEVPNIKVAKSCIRSAAHVVKWKSSSQNITKQQMRFFLPSRFYGKSDDFYDCLFALARILTSRAGLEDTFTKTGDTLPSERQIADIVMKTINRIYKPTSRKP